MVWIGFRAASIALLLGLEMGPGGMSYLLYMPGLMLIMSGVELLFTGMAGRILWPRQIRLYIPEPEETEDEEAGE